MTREDGDPRDSLKPQPGQSDFYTRQFHPLPGPWAQQQLSSSSEGRNMQSSQTQASPMSSGSQISGPTGELRKALEAEKRQHKYWEEAQGVFPGEPAYENPREWQNTLLPTAKYGTEGRGYG